MVTILTNITAATIATMTNTTTTLTAVRLACGEFVTRQTPTLFEPGIFHDSGRCETTRGLRCFIVVAILKPLRP